MSYTDTQRSEIKRDFARRRRNQLLLTIIFIPLIFPVLLYTRHLAGTIYGLSGQVAAPIFLALVVGAGIFSYLNWRCPGCSKYLGRTFFSLRRCPHCDVELRA